MKLIFDVHERMGTLDLMDIHLDGQLYVFAPGAILSPGRVSQLIHHDASMFT